jgi:hypothetical protein|tara:strand:- start:55 stop:318 length:264 start_codon:yes stop_codon:yes gene_type:complete
MIYHTTFKGSSPTLQDYIDVLPRTENFKLIKRSNNSYITNCVGKNHNDRNPSMALARGDKRVVYKCFAGCPQEHLTDFFNGKLRGRA